MTYESGMELDMFSGNFDNLLCCTVQNKCETASQAAEQAPIASICYRFIICWETLPSHPDPLLAFFLLFSSIGRCFGMVLSKVKECNWS